jgi:hypothetical protein
LRRRFFNMSDATGAVHAGDGESGFRLAHFL